MSELQIIIGQHHLEQILDSESFQRNDETDLHSPKKAWKIICSIELHDTFDETFEIASYMLIQYKTMGLPQVRLTEIISSN